MYTERKIHRGFVGLLFLVALVVLFLFHTRPTQRNLRDLGIKTSQFSEEVKKLGGAKTARGRDGALSEVEQRELVAAIPQTLEQDMIIRGLTNAAKTADVNINAVTFTLQKNTDIPTVTISAGFQGTPQNIVRFLKLIEVNPRKFMVQDAAVSRVETAGGLELLNLNLTIQAFYRHAS